MQTIEIKRTPLEIKDFVKRRAETSDFKTLITEPCLITENGVPRILYAKVDPVQSQAVRSAVKAIKYTPTQRTAGLKTTSATFGYAPRNTIMKNYCSATVMAANNPKQHSAICDFGETLASLYSEFFPDVYKMHKGVVSEKMLPEWVIGQTPFTSGIVNKNNPLKYHFDGGNIKDVLSNMVVFKHGVVGGFLSCPEFGIGFECADNTVILFDGQNILHGVTPIQKQTESAYRYSVVYYTLQQIWNCKPITEEIIFARQNRAKRERNRVLGITNLRRKDD
jgi:hypothetical protein